MRYKAYLVLLVLVASVAILPTSNAATPVPGKPCSKLGQVQFQKSKNYTCIKSGKKLVWNKGVAVQKPTPTPTATLSGQVSPPVKGIRIYTAAPTSVEQSFDLPVSVESAPAGTNIKLWIYNPSEKKSRLGSVGDWIGVNIGYPNGDYVLKPANPDGSFYTKLISGTYLFDIVVPNPNPEQFVQKRYKVTVSNSGDPSITRMRSNSAGFFTVTVDLPKSESLNKFVATTQCQLLDQTDDAKIRVGFPKPPARLPSFGTLNALIIPVDFQDVPGRRAPAEEFTLMTDATNVFYYATSGNRVKFDFQVIKNWVRMPVSSTFHKLGTPGYGDIFSYWELALATADPLVDFSQFDVVYVLSPRETPSSSIAWGPAGALDSSSGYPGISTDDGLVTNITSSGADAWQNVAQGTPWVWMAHETGHLFGLHDLYVNPGAQTFGAWDLMASNSSKFAIEINSWNRYVQGWFTDSQIKCLNAVDINTTGVTQLINPLSRINQLTKAVVVRLSDTKVLVIESRRNEGFDVLTPAQEGSLVYTVDMTIPSMKGGWKVQRRAGSTDPFFLDAALRPGGVITVEGLRIEVISRDQNGDTVKVSRP